jgi:hypothetical protein
MATFSLVLSRSSGVAATRNSGACVSEKTEVRVGGDSFFQKSIYGASHERYGASHVDNVIFKCSQIFTNVTRAT